MTTHDPRKTPSEEHRNLYPGLVVDDGRVGGSITLGPTRLPLWALLADLVAGGAAEAHDAYDLNRGHNITPEQFQNLMVEFLASLLEQRGDFARLLLVLADVERTHTDSLWWEDECARKRVQAALEECLQTIKG